MSRGLGDVYKRQPKVEGVLVVAEGAGKGNMTSEITQIAQALFGVEAHKVKVLEK